VTGVDSVSKSLHGFEGDGFSLLAHDVFDPFCQTRIVAMAEYGIIPASMDSEAVEVDIVFDDVLVILHPQVVDTALSVTGRIDGTKLSTEGMDEGGDTLTITYTVRSTTTNTQKTRRRRRVCDCGVTGRSQCDSPRGSAFLDTEANKRTTKVVMGVRTLKE
jgi:hypothetical protein